MKSPRKKESIGYKLSEVISVVSHQLKTPLSVIKGYLEVLIAEDLGGINKKQREYLNGALENTRQMGNLVRDLLDVSRVEENRLEFRPKPSSLERIVKEVIKEFQPVAQAKNCTLSLKVLEKIPLLNIDPLKIKQVVVNIISNAVEYNKRKGEVEVGIRRRGNKALFYCKDAGIGIFNKEKKKIFTKFYRGEQAVILAAKGSGLGLFISKAIINKSGGKIWFKSRKGEGSTFYFSLPIKN